MSDGGPQEASEVPAKRKRGRPRGSKNQPGQPSKTGRPVGRPRKVPLDQQGSSPAVAPSYFVASEERSPGCTHVLLILSGSVASIKAPLIVSELMSYHNVKVEVVATKASFTFFDREAIIRAGSRVWVDEDEWPKGYKLGDPILHIELRSWADIVLVAPCSANTLAKIAGGQCDNLATSLLRALAPTTPTYIFPAMNTLMYEHPLTEHHLRVVKDIIGYNVVGPICKALACGDVGLGAMTEWKDVVQIVVDRFQLARREDATSLV